MGIWTKIRISLTKYFDLMAPNKNMNLTKDLSEIVCSKISANSRLHASQLNNLFL